MNSLNFLTSSSIDISGLSSKDFSNEINSKLKEIIIHLKILIILL